MDDNLLKIINHYGVCEQLKKLSGKIYYLQEKILLGIGDNLSLYNIIKAREDVEILLRQIDLYFDINYNDLTRGMVEKVNKQIERINNENRTQ